MTNNYVFFYSTKHPFSQWHVSKFTDNYGITYFCMEQYMMAEKTRLFLHNSDANINILLNIMSSKNQKDIKKLGRQVVGFNQNIWDDNKFDIVVRGNLLKFTQNISIKKILLDTSDKIIVEASAHDKIWGIGFNECNAMENISKWGENLLGKALIVVRDVLNK